MWGAGSSRADVLLLVLVTGDNVDYLEQFENSLVSAPVSAFPEGVSQGGTFPRSVVTPRQPGLAAPWLFGLLPAAAFLIQTLQSLQSHIRGHQSELKSTLLCVGVGLAQESSQCAVISLDPLVTSCPGLLSVRDYTAPADVPCPFSLRSQPQEVVLIPQVRLAPEGQSSETMHLQPEIAGTPTLCDGVLD